MTLRIAADPLRDLAAAWVADGWEYHRRGDAASRDLCWAHARALTQIGGAMGEIWIPEAEDLKAIGTSGTMTGKGGPRATLHCTVSAPGSFDAMHRVLTGKASEPHLLYDPKTDRLGQYFALNRSARALMGSPAVNPSHNKVGTVNIQIEVCAFPDDWTKGWTPGPNFAAMLRAIRSWGIADEFVARLPTSAIDRINVARSAAFLTSSKGGGKWWGHCHYPSPETHWDPGPIKIDRFFAGGDMPLTKDDINAVADEVMNRLLHDDTWPIPAASASKLAADAPSSDKNWTLPTYLSVLGSRTDRIQAAVANPAGMVDAITAKIEAAGSAVDKAAIKEALSEWFADASKADTAGGGQ